MPFACRQLLSLSLHCPRLFSQASFSNTGQGRRFGKTLIHLLDAQAKEFDSKFHNPPRPYSDSRVSLKPTNPEGDEKNGALFNPRFVPVHPSCSAPPLRI
jgi:hypothetical protein